MQIESKQSFRKPLKIGMAMNTEQSTEKRIKKYPPLPDIRKYRYPSNSNNSELGHSVMILLSKKELPSKVRNSKANIVSNSKTSDIEFLHQSNDYKTDQGNYSDLEIINEDVRGKHLTPGTKTRNYKSYKNYPFTQLKQNVQIQGQ